MRAWQPISLFNDPPPSRSRPSAFAVSMLAHGAALGITYLVVVHGTHIVAPSPRQIISLRMLELNRPDPDPPEPASSRSLYAPSTALAAAGESAGSAGAAPSVLEHMQRLLKGPQTLVQPDLPPMIEQQKLPIPAALLWSASNIHVTTISPPERLDTSARVSPSLQPPNREPNLSNTNISATLFATDRPALPPGTTSPVVVSGANPQNKTPEMWSIPTRVPSPATLISTSDMEMLQGTIALPPINEVADASSKDGLAAGHGQGKSSVGSGQAASQGPDASAQANAQEGHGTGNAVGNAIGSKEGSSPQGSPSGQNPDASVAQTAGADAGSGLGNGLSVSRIKLAKNGKFGVVVVGSSLAERYPEINGLWRGRLAYTVYVHTGLPKSWILQYSLPASADAAAAGENTRPEAPWPFDIVVPHGATSEVTADALMIHGFVNTAGRFEQLAVVSPQDYAEKAFMLSALGEWQFRPASQNGQPTAVEVLLIIPLTE